MASQDKVLTVWRNSWLGIRLNAIFISMVLTRETSWVIRHYRNWLVLWDMFWIHQWQSSRCSRFPYRFLRVLARIRAHNLEGFFVRNLLRVVRWFYHLIILPGFSEQSYANSRVIQFFHELKRELPETTLRQLGMILEFLVLSNIFLFIIFHREMDWVGQYFRLIWVLIGGIMMLSPLPLKCVLESSRWWLRWGHRWFSERDH